MFAVSLALLADAFRGKDRGVAFGVWGAITGLAVAVGPVLGGALTSGLSWRWIFFVNLPIGLAAVLITLTRVHESRDPRPAGRTGSGFVLFTAALAFLVFGLIESTDVGFTDGLVLGCFAAAAVLLVAFLAGRAAGAHPMFDLSLFRSRPSRRLDRRVRPVRVDLRDAAVPVLYLQDVLGYSRAATGLRLLRASGGILVAAHDRRPAVRRASRCGC